MLNYQQNKQSFFTRSSVFQRLTAWAFGVCDVDGTGKVNPDELYAGILLVHLQLAKYAGPAACYPPSRKTVNELFEKSDDDGSGFLDLAEFSQIVAICSAQVFSRILVYYGFIILLVPRLAATLVDGLSSWDFLPAAADVIPNKLGSLLYPIVSMARLMEQFVSLLLFFLVIPLCFNYIDKSSRQAASSYVIVGQNSNNGKNSTASSSSGSLVDDAAADKTD